MDKWKLNEKDVKTKNWMIGLFLGFFIGAILLMVGTTSMMWTDDFTFLIVFVSVGGFILISSIIGFIIVSMKLGFKRGLVIQDKALDLINKATDGSFSKKSVATELEKLEILYRSKAITKQEYEKAKAKVLD